MAARTERRVRNSERRREELKRLVAERDAELAHWRNPRRTRVRTRSAPPRPFVPYKIMRRMRRRAVA